MHIEICSYKIIFSVVLFSRLLRLLESSVLIFWFEQILDKLMSLGFIMVDIVRYLEVIFRCGKIILTQLNLAYIFQRRVCILALNISIFVFSEFCWTWQRIMRKSLANLCNSCNDSSSPGVYLTCSSFIPSGYVLYLGSCDIWHRCSSWSICSWYYDWINLWAPCWHVCC